jgi:hypothetical protein
MKKLGKQTILITVGAGYFGLFISLYFKKKKGEPDVLFSSIKKAKKILVWRQRNDIKFVFERFLSLG